MPVPRDKLLYFGRSLLRNVTRRYTRCQNCGADARTVVDRKYLVTQLNRCGHCLLLYRTPADTASDNARVYGAGGSYAETTPTQLPDDATLRRLVSTNFAGSPQDYAAVVRTLDALGVRPGARVFDFGCAWGYGSYQLARAGYEVYSSEIDARRFAFATDRLSVTPLPAQLDPPRTEADRFDCFFSSHVMEHVPAPHVMFDRARAMLRDGGMFVSLTPNGSSAHRRANPGWSLMWGRDHPNYIDEVFLQKQVGPDPHLFTSRQMETAAGCPLDNPEQAARARAHLTAGQGTLTLGTLERPELLFAASVSRD